MSRTYKPFYRGSRVMDRTCRCNGSCDYCRNNRLHAVKRQQAAAEYDRLLWARGERLRAIQAYQFERDADDYEALAEDDQRRWMGRG